MPNYYPFNYSRTDLTRVTGIESAKAYQMPPNSTAALFDTGDDLLYIKSTDGAGFPTIRTFRFTEVQNAPEQSKNYVTRDEVAELIRDALKGVNTNAVKSVSE